MHIQAFAKINLSLEIVGKRPDGYHELVSVMQTVSLADTVTLASSSGIRFSCSMPSLSQDNLVERAAVLLERHFRPPIGVSIELEKKIPAAAGLGGGSSDAASTLAALSRFWNLSLTCAQLRELAEELGSDVPFFLWGGRCLVEGRGEQITPLPAILPTWYLLVNPRIEVSTARIFGELRPSEWTDGARTRELAASASGELGINGLEGALFRLYPVAWECYDAVSLIAPAGARVSGSGPTVFARFSTPDAAQDAAARLSATGYWTAVVTAHLDRTEFSPCS